MIYNLPYIAPFILIILGLSALIFKKNLLKMVIGVILIHNGISLFIVTIGYINETTHDTFPQFLAFANIIIGIGIISRRQTHAASY